GGIGEQAAAEILVAQPPRADDRADEAGVDPGLVLVGRLAGLDAGDRRRLLFGQRRQDRGDPADVLGQLLEDGRAVVAADVVELRPGRAAGADDLGDSLGLVGRAE